MQIEEIAAFAGVIALVAAMVLLALKEVLTRDFMRRTEFGDAMKNRNVHGKRRDDDIEKLKHTTEQIMTLTLGNQDMIAENRRKVDEVDRFGSQPLRAMQKRQAKQDRRLDRLIWIMEERFGLPHEHDHNGEDET